MSEAAATADLDSMLATYRPDHVGVTATAEAIMDVEMLTVSGTYFRYSFPLYDAAP
jgi:hypothetical protein